MPLPARMSVWAVVSDEIDRVIEFFPTRWQAESMLAARPGPVRADSDYESAAT